MRQCIASEVETIVKDEVTLSLEALIRFGAKRLWSLSWQPTTRVRKTRKMNVVTDKWSGFVLTSHGN